MPGTPLLVQQPIVSLLREVEENLLLTRRSQAALESAASTAGSERHRQSRSAEQLQQQQRRQTASAATSLSRSSIAKSAQRQASPAAGSTGIPQQLSFDAALSGRGSPARLPQVMRALPVTPFTRPPGEPFWTSNELADSASGRTASSSTDNAAAGYFGSPIHSAIGVSPSESGSQPAGSRQQSSAKQRDPQVGLQKENSPAGSSKALGNKRLPQAADRPSDLRYKYSAARAGKREDVSGAVCNCALGSEVIQQQALLLAEQARSAQASVDKTFAAAESEMQNIFSSLQERRSSRLGYGSGAKLSLVDTREADRLALAKQTAEIASLEDGLKEISACLARSLRQNDCLKEETAELRQIVALLQCRQQPDTPSGSEAYELHSHRHEDVITEEESCSAALAHRDTGGGSSVKQTNEFTAAPAQPQRAELQRQAAASGSTSVSLPGSGPIQTAAASVRAENAPPASTGQNNEHPGLHKIQGPLIANQVSWAAALPEASSSKQRHLTASVLTGRATEGCRSGALQRHCGGASLTAPAAQYSSPSRQGSYLPRDLDCTLSESVSSRHGGVRWLQRSGWERTKSSWDTPSPPVMSAKAREALQAALSAIRQLEESSHEAARAEQRSSPLMYQSSSNRNRYTRDSSVAAGKALHQQERLQQQICGA